MHHYGIVLGYSDNIQSLFRLLRIEPKNKKLLFGRTFFLLFIVRRTQHGGAKLGYVTINRAYKTWYHTGYRRALHDTMFRRTLYDTMFRRALHDTMFRRTLYDTMFRRTLYDTMFRRTLYDTIFYRLY